MKTDVVIIGAGLTGLSLGFFLKKAGIGFIIIEKDDRAGGVINTVAKDGFIFETGPNTGVLSTPELVELFEDLGDSCTLEKADSSAGKRYILKDGRWEAIPSGLISAIKTPLFTFGDKLRILGEPFRKPGDDPDESVAQIVRRRLGKSFLDYAVNPFISGVYAGDPEKLITRYALPKLYALEHNHGSFIRGSIAKAGQKKTELEKKATREVFSAKEGLSNLTRALSDGIGNDLIYTGFHNTVINPWASGYTVTTGNKEGKILQINATRVVSTIGGYNLPPVLPFVNSGDLEKITRLDYARVVQASVGYKSWDGMKLDAFGGLVPEKEKRKILGILFPSAIFRDRAPQNGALLSVFMGGMRDPELIDKGDDEITEIALGEIRKTLHSKNSPDLIRISRYNHAIPQYGKGSGERLQSIKNIESSNQGLILAGNIRDGIGMADRVKQAKNIADLILQKK